MRFSCKYHQEDPQEVHESQTNCYDVSKQAAEGPQPKKKLVPEKLRRNCFGICQRKTQDVVENLKKSITHLRINFKRKSMVRLVQLICKQTESEDIVRVG